MSFSIVFHRAQLYKKDSSFQKLSIFIYLIFIVLKKMPVIKVKCAVSGLSLYAVCSTVSIVNLILFNSPISKFLMILNKFHVTFQFLLSLSLSEITLFSCILFKTKIFQIASPISSIFFLVSLRYLSISV